MGGPPGRHETNSHQYSDVVQQPEQMVDQPGGDSGRAPRRTLLTVSGVIPATLDADVAAGRRPRADYRVLADHLEADVIDVTGAERALGRFGSLLGRAGAGPVLAWYAWRRRRNYDVILTDGEQVGLPLAILMRWFGSSHCRHVMIVHILSVPKKSWLIRLTRIASAVDHYIVYSSAQADAIRRFGVPTARITRSTFMVDTKFFRPISAHGKRPTICSAGLERRDYATLVRAVDGLDVEVVIAAASPWSRQHDSSSGLQIPENVTVERLSLDELRDLYSRSRFVVMPLVDVPFQAGITTILEAMAMGRAVICTKTSGQTDTIVDGVTGIYVPPDDAVALRAAIERLVASSEECDALGRAARTWAVEHAELDRYAERLAGVVRALDVQREA